MPVPQLKLYVDVVSPFAYLAYYILRNDPTFSKCKIIYEPIFLGGVMKACGNAAPITIKNKGPWLNRERLRWSQAFNVPMVENSPPGFPPLTITVMRAMCAILLLHPGEEGQKLLTKSLDAIFKAHWVEHEKVQDKDVLLRILQETLGDKETGKVMEKAATEAKEQLIKNTDGAFQAGAFGLPWFEATNSKGVTESFWGVDHLGQVTEHLGIEKPKTGGWKALL